jgi:hypothetical protein
VPLALPMRKGSHAVALKRREAKSKIVGKMKRTLIFANKRQCTDLILISKDKRVSVFWDM